MSIADSFIDDREFLSELSPKEKVGAFIEGMRLSAIDLVEFRCAAETRALVAEDEDSIRQIMNALELVLTSIKIEHETKKPNGKWPTLIVMQ